MRPVSLFDGNHLKFYSADNANSALMYMVGESVLLEANLKVSGSITADFLILVNGLNTDDITEGETNKYYTDELVDSRISALVPNEATLKTYFDTIYTLENLGGVASLGTSADILLSTSS